MLLYFAKASINICSFLILRNLVAKDMELSHCQTQNLRSYSGIQNKRAAQSR